MLFKLMAIAVAGGLGTLCRFGLTSFLHERLPEGYTFLETAVVNLAGCFLFGLVWALADSRELFNDQMRMIILIGFMGAFTTFSTYIFQSNELVLDGRLWGLFVNLFVQNVFGFAALILGIVIGRV